MSAAPATRASPAPPAPPAPGVAEWEGEDVGVAEIAARLGPLRQQATGGRMQGLASVLNLIAWAPEPEEGPREEELIEGLADHQPSRVVIVAPGAGAGGQRIRAHVETRCGGGPRGGFCVELIRLTLGAEIIPHAASAVVPLLRSELPTYLWWPAPPEPTAAFRGLAALADRVVCEAALGVAGPPALRALTACLGDLPGQSQSRMGLWPTGKRELLRFAPRIPYRMTDLAWAAITPWRQLTAQMLGADALARLRGGPSSLLAMHAGTEPTLEALLYAGWLRDVVGNAIGVRTQPADEGEDALVAIEISGPTGARLRADRIFGAHSAAVTVTAEGATRRRTLPLPARDRTALLAGELELQGRDRAFERALSRAAELV